jgi:hypothetical protein
VRVLEGSVDINAEQRERLSAEELAAGWRLSCQCSLEDNLVIELRQWDAAILVDDSVFSFEPRDGLGVAVDLGTTTLVAQLLDLRTGRVLGVRTALNAQARFGADVMSRVRFGLEASGATQLRDIIRRQIGSLLEQLMASAHTEGREIRDVTLVGNTVMHHLFCGLDVEPLSRYPFESAHLGAQVFAAGDLGWKMAGEPRVRFLPCIGGFVGSDILAGIMATRIAEREERPEWRRIAISVVPGISALQAAAARLGAPLGHDFCAISLSDLLTPWPVIERRLIAAAEGDFVLALYNPRSARRQTQLGAARDILLRHRAAETPVALARNLGRAGETIELTTLGALDPGAVDMLTLVLIGSSATRVIAGTPPILYTPRGYAAKRGAP